MSLSNYQRLMHNMFLMLFLCNIFLDLFQSNWFLAVRWTATRQYED